MSTLIKSRIEEVEEDEEQGGRYITGVQCLEDSSVSGLNEIIFLEAKGSEVDLEVDEEVDDEVNLLPHVWDTTEAPNLGIPSVFESTGQRKRLNEFGNCQIPLREYCLLNQAFNSTYGIPRGPSCQVKHQVPVLLEDTNDQLSDQSSSVELVPTRPRILENYHLLEWSPRSSYTHKEYGELIRILVTGPRDQMSLYCDILDMLKFFTSVALVLKVHQLMGDRMKMAIKVRDTHSVWNGFNRSAPKFSEQSRLITNSDSFKVQRLPALAPNKWHIDYDMSAAATKGKYQAHMESKGTLYKYRATMKSNGVRGPTSQRRKLFDDLLGCDRCIRNTQYLRYHPPLSCLECLGELKNDKCCSEDIYIDSQLHLQLWLYTKKVKWKDEQGGLSTKKPHYSKRKKKRWKNAGELNASTDIWGLSVVNFLEDVNTRNTREVDEVALMRATDLSVPFVVQSEALVAQYSERRRYQEAPD